MAKKDTNTAVMDPELIQAALRECEEKTEQPTPDGCESTVRTDRGTAESGEAQSAHETPTGEKFGAVTWDDVPAPSSRGRRDRKRTYAGAFRTEGIDLDVDLVPQMALSPDQIPWHSLDHRAGYLLRQVDGQRSCRDIIDTSGIDPLQARDLLVSLLAQGCIKLP